MRLHPPFPYMHTSLNSWNSDCAIEAQVPSYQPACCCLCNSQDNAPLKSIGKIGAIAIEIWTVDSGYQFSNIMVTPDAQVAKEFREQVGDRGL